MAGSYLTARPWWRCGRLAQ